MAEVVRKPRAKKDESLGEVIENVTEESIEKGTFMDKIWKPAFAVTYMLICLFDFIAGPIIYNVLQYLNPGQHLDMWQPLTLQGGGLYHIAMGVVLGITAHGRTQEKINGASTPSLPGPMGMLAETIQQPAPQPMAQPSFQPQPIAQPSFQPQNPGTFGLGNQSEQQFGGVQSVGSNKFGRVVPPAEDPMI